MFLNEVGCDQADWSESSNLDKNGQAAEQISNSGDWGASELFLASVAMCEECSLLHTQANYIFYTHDTASS